MPCDKIPICDTPITLDDIINCLKETYNAPETETIYIPNKGLATIPLKEYRKMMFYDCSCFICSKEMEERINKEMIEELRKGKYELLSTKLLNMK
nr:MAG: hypothetical protein [Bacteriophage sp.]